MLHKRNDEKCVAAEHDEDVKFVPAASHNILLTSLQPHSEQQVDADRDVESQFHRDEHWRLGHFKAVNHCDNYQTDADDQQAYIEVLALRRVVHMMQQLIKSAVLYVEELIGLRRVEWIAIIAGPLECSPHTTVPSS